MKIEVSDDTFYEALMGLSGRAEEFRHSANQSTADDIREIWIDWYFAAELAYRELSTARSRAIYEEVSGEPAPADYPRGWLPSAIDVELERYWRFRIPPGPDSHHRGLGAIAGALRIIGLEAAFVGQFNGQ